MDGGCAAAGRLTGFRGSPFIGVVKDVKQGGIDRKTGTELYFDIDQLPATLPNSMPQTVNVVLRTSLPPTSLAATIQHTVASLDPSIPVVRLRTMDEVFAADSLGRPRLLAQLLTAFAAVAVLLAEQGVLTFDVSWPSPQCKPKEAVEAFSQFQARLLATPGIVATSAGI